MKRLHKAMISFGIVAVLMSGSSSVFAKSETSRGRNISGSIVSIDRTARIITVRTYSTGEAVQVKVPDGSFLRTNQQVFAIASFEQLLPGMFVRNVHVK